jgi:RecA-family ATPase
MRESPPHSPTQSFVSDIEDAVQIYRENGYRHETRPSAPVVRLPASNGSRFFSPATLDGLPIPDRRWIVEGLIPAGNVTMLSGDGGLGKSLLAMQLLTCVAIGKPWLGLPTTQCNAIGVFCEDERDELHIRQSAINASYGCAFLDLSSCLWMPRVGEANVMRHFGDKGPGDPTKFYSEVKERVKATGSRLVVIDSLHDVFSGNENFRGNARQFISDLRAIVLPVDGAVLLLSHPSMSGMNTGTGAAGSTAWHNAVRSRLYLTRPVRKSSSYSEEPDDGDSNERVLKTMKSNYGAIGGTIPLRWEHGVFVRQDAAQPASFIDKLNIDRMALEGLRLLVSDGTLVPSDKSAPKSFANALRKLPSCRHLTQGALVAAQDRLLNEKRIERVELGPPSKRRVYLRPVEMLLPGEVREGK